MVRLRCIYSDKRTVHTFLEDLLGFQFLLIPEMNTTRVRCKFPRGLVILPNWLGSRHREKISILRGKPDHVPSRKCVEAPLPAPYRCSSTTPWAKQMQVKATTPCSWHDAKWREKFPSCSKRTVMGTWKLKFLFSPPLWLIEL